GFDRNAMSTSPRSRLNFCGELINFIDLEFSFFASDEYIKNNGFPDFDGDLSDHIFIGSYVEEVLRTPFMDWMERIVQNDSIRIRTNRYDDAESLVSEGLGIGALLRKSAQWMPWLREVMPARDNWIVPVWRITHVDLHRSSKVQSFLRVLHKHQQKHGTIQDLEKSIAVQI
ncbi:MAG: LysR substrate-binding domain-containing protein, partial [Pseudomonadota bacterium]